MSTDGIWGKRVETGWERGIPKKGCRLRRTFVSGRNGVGVLGDSGVGTVGQRGMWVRSSDFATVSAPALTRGHALPPFLST